MPVLLAPVTVGRATRGNVTPTLGELGHEPCERVRPSRFGETYRSTRMVADPESCTSPTMGPTRGTSVGER